MSATKKGAVIALQAMFGTTRYLGAFTTATTSLGGGTEVSGNGYARSECPPMTIVESVEELVPSHAENAVEVPWPESTGAWGEVTHVGVFDSLSGGNMIGHAALVSPKTVSDGDILRFKAGELKFTAE